MQKSSKLVFLDVLPGWPSSHLQSVESAKDWENNERDRRSQDCGRLLTAHVSFSFCSKTRSRKDDPLDVAFRHVRNGKDREGFIVKQVPPEGIKGKWLFLFVINSWWKIWCHVVTSPWSHLGQAPIETFRVAGLEIWCSVSQIRWLSLFCCEN